MRRISVCVWSFFFAIALFGIDVQAQVAIGAPQFNDLGGGPFDKVNIGNLNVHFVVPVLQKAGRGRAFSYNLTYDGSIWQPVTSGSTKTWTRVGSNNWGWTNSMRGGGQITESQTIDQEPCVGPGGISKTETTTTTTGVTYYDWIGTAHRFFGIAVHKTGCTTQNTGFGPRSATDGSGYQITVDGSGDVLSLVARDGSLISTTIGFNAITDANGNEISSSTASGTTTFTDTLGAVALTASGSGTPTSPITLQYTSPAGSAANYTLQFTSYTVKTNFGVSGIAEYGPIANSLISGIQLPDGTNYSFTYEQTPGSCTPLSGTFQNCITGRIASVTLPTGGTVTYLYSGGPNNTGIFADGSTAGLTRILAASTACIASNSCWQYSRTLISGTPGSGSTWTTTVVDPNSNSTVFNFAEDSGTSSGTVASFNMYETQRTAYQGSTSGTLLLSSVTCYNANFAGCASATVSSPITEKDAYTQLANGNTRLSSIAYNSAGLVTDDKEYGYGVTMGSAPGTSNLIRETVTTYGTFNGSSCIALGNNIVGKPCQVIINDWTSGTATNIATTSYTYDQNSLTTTTGTPQHTSVSGSRGNLTTVAIKANSATTLSQTFTYFDTGTPNVVTDINGAQSSYTYGTTAQGSSTISCGNSFPTTINEPLGLSRSIVWNCTGGVSTQVTDENGKNVTSSYSDPDFWRPANVIDQLSDQKNFSYVAQTSVESALQNFNGGSSASDRLSTVDGFGRPILSQKLQAPSSSNYDTVETDYNNVGLPQRTTMPFNALAGVTNSSAPGTTNTYDALGRVLTIAEANGGQVAYTYTNNDVLQQVSGTQVFQKQFEYDGLGRLISVCEITSAAGSGTCGQSTTKTGFWTKYSYDAVSHLLTVTQNAQASSASQQKRTFVYDMMGRVTSESNPETGNNGTSGTVTYTYDSISPCADGNSYSSAGDLVQQTDNAGNVTCFSYDALHRVLQEGNKNISGATIRKFSYDSEISYPTGVTVINGKTRIVEAQTLNTSSSVITDEFFSYSARGELTDIYESTPHSAGFYHTTAAYWATGTLKALSGIPGVPTINYGANGAGLDGEGRITQVTAATGTNPVTSVTYSTSGSTNVLGAVTGVTFGSLDSDTFTYDPNTSRMLTYSFNVNGKADKGTLTWNTNGTLGKLVVADQITGTSDSQTCTYSYDDLQRVSGASCGSLWSQTFSYDPFGNITKSGSSSFAPAYVFSNNATTNQFFSLPGVTVSYDKNGNLLTDNLNAYTWDANWGGLLSASNGSTTVNVTYDALGRMVEKSTSGTFTELIYGPTGAKLATMNGQTLIKAFIALPGGAKAVYSSSGLAYYRHSDWIGSSRLASTPTRGLFSSTAYAPFGEQYGTAANSDASFTGQDQDTLSTLFDFAFRRFSPSQGRWISPDPSGRNAATPTRPQSWNRYAYVTNNPLRLIDIMGLFADDPGGDLDTPFCDDLLSCSGSAMEDDGSDTVPNMDFSNSGTDLSTINSILGIPPAGIATGIELVGPVASYSGPNDYVDPITGAPGQILPGLEPGSTVASTTFEFQAIDAGGSPVTGNFNIVEDTTLLVGNMEDVASPTFPAGGTIFDTYSVPTSTPSTGALTYGAIQQQTFEADDFDTPGGYLPNPISGTFYQVISVQNGVAQTLGPIQVAPVSLP